MAADMHGIAAQILLLTLCLSTLTRAYYADDNMEDTIDKRNYQRRSFLKSFCARRCNIGLGGNVCRCNGFHFAGKRTSEPFDVPTKNFQDDVFAYFLHDRPQGVSGASDEKPFFPPRTSEEFPESDEEIRELLPIVLRQSLKQSNLDLAAKLFGAIADRGRPHEPTEEK